MTKGGEMVEPCEPPPEPTSSLSTPPAASHNPSVLTTPPAVQAAGSTSLTGSPNPRRAPSLVEEALDLDLEYCSSQEEDTPPSHRGKAAAARLEGELEATQQGIDADLQCGGHRIRSVVVRPTAHRVSYKDALLRGRAFNAANNQRRSIHWCLEW